MVTKGHSYFRMYESNIQIIIFKALQLNKLPLPSLGIVYLNLFYTIKTFHLVI